MRARDDVVPALARSPLFAGISKHELQEIAGTFDETTFLPEHGVLHEHRIGLEFFFILDGTATVEVDGTQIAELGPGDFFGEVSALDGGPRTATVRARTMLRCLVLPNGTFREFLMAHPRVAVNLIPELVRRFRSYARSE
ncbi:MAG: cyclic nucleotide-binding protein [Chloroflexi bacterium]|jgi:CRP/FNR family cyclic AMP-dependent transcriptional regulator|nr:cyclic nucleotide-binding protein [Chloroflexota bacterium]MEA2618631.1 family transcriptional regulator, cyclic receptor protein [Chloroflexota bacterium]